MQESESSYPPPPTSSQAPLRSVPCQYVQNNVVAALPKDLDQTLVAPDVTYFFASANEAILAPKYKGKGQALPLKSIQN